MKNTFLLSFLIFFYVISSAQIEKYMLKEFRQAYDKKTRNKDGKPGEKYFTNFSDYIIDVNFEPKTGLLVGKEKITYHNQSPDTLKNMIIKLNQNLFAKGNPRDFAINPLDAGSGMIIKKIFFNGNEIKSDKYNIYSTNLFLELPNFILPKSEITIEIEWEYIVAQNTTVRNGKYGENVYFIGYWYPQIAVYDDVFGWDINTYTGATEFYNEHSNYEVNITVKGQNIVWATGELLNPAHIFTPRILERFKQAKISDEVVKIITQEDYKIGKILQNTNTTTWIYKAKQVPDFAFAISDKHNWDGVSILIPYLDNKLLINAVYKEETKNFHQLAQMTREIISAFSFKIPAIPFPYPVMTVFDGGGAMEYPMMVNQETNDDLCADYYVTAHEVGHSYFPFYTGTNETRYAWMDEGFISFFPRLVTDYLMPECKYEQKIIDNYQKLAGSFTDMPLMNPTSFYKDFYSYRAIAYDKSSFMLLQLYKYLGDEVFFGALKEFFTNWKLKHPYPYDFFNTIETYTNQDLDWFLEPYFFSFCRPDLSLDSVYFEAGVYIKIKNTGGIPLPIYIEIEFSDGKKQIYQNKADVWRTNSQHDIYIPMENTPKKIILGNYKIPDINIKDNFYDF